MIHIFIGNFHSAELMPWQIPKNVKISFLKIPLIMGDTSKSISGLLPDSGVPKNKKSMRFLLSQKVMNDNYPIIVKYSHFYF